MVRSLLGKLAWRRLSRIDPSDARGFSEWPTTRPELAKHFDRFGFAAKWRPNEIQDFPRQPLCDSGIGLVRVGGSSRTTKPLHAHVTVGNTPSWPSGGSECPGLLPARGRKTVGKRSLLSLFASTGRRTSLAPTRPVSRPADSGPIENFLKLDSGRQTLFGGKERFTSEIEGIKRKSHRLASLSQFVGSRLGQ